VGGTGPFNITISDLTLNNSSGGGGINTDQALNGTWGRTDNDGNANKMTFNNGNYESTTDRSSGITGKKGTYTTSGNNITVTITHIHGNNKELYNLPGIEAKWYSKNDLKTSFGSYFTDEQLNNMFPPSQTGTYSINGNTLTTQGAYIWTKK
jgi:hypothetical protein